MPSDQDELFTFHDIGDEEVQVDPVVSSPPPPHIEEITEPPKSSDHELLLEELPMFIPNLFSEEEYIELGHVSIMS